MTDKQRSKKESEQSFTQISELGEFGLIRQLTKNFKPSNDTTLKAVGDDAAVIRHKDEVSLFTTDMLVEGVHFDMVYTPLKHLGYKAVIANLSDIYAMNAHPSQITVSLAISNKYPVEALAELYQGIQIACERYNVDLVGGDTTTSLKGMVISVTAVGQAKQKEVVYRDTAKPGDVICVTGDLGGAYIGLLLLEREKEVFMENTNMQPKLQEHEYVVGRMLKPEARKDIIDLFADQNIQPTAMIDVSDGASSDMLHICDQSNVGCMLYEDDFPIDPNTYHKALDFDLDPTMCFLNGGEDYELLFTLQEKDYKKISKSPDITKIGKIVDEKENCKLTTKSDKVHDLVAQGWDPIKSK